VRREAVRLWLNIDTLLANFNLVKANPVAAQGATDGVAAVGDWCCSRRYRVAVIPPASNNREVAVRLFLYSPDGGQASIW
jgi:hypothetical protein